ncbi:hypothetical protein PMAYCL1PPCAC_29391, partial [Pristionchus mayeri]
LNSVQISSARLSSMSSDSDSSDDDRKKKGRNKKMDSDDSDDERKPKRRGKETGSSSEEESEKPSSSRKRKAPTSKGSTKKRGRGRASSDEDGIAISGVDGLELTEEDRKKIQGMSEKDREQEIFRRMEEMERRKIREQIAKRLEEKSKKESSPDGKERGRTRKKERRVVSDGSDDSLSSERNTKSPLKNKKKVKVDSEEEDGELRVMPSEANRKKKQKNAMEDLLNKRREKEAKKASLAVDAVFGKENDSSSESSSSSNSSRSSSPSSRSSSPSRSRSASPNKEDLAAKRPVDCVEELSLARLSRFKLAKIVHAPFFAKTVQDCYVRIGVGKMPGRPNKDNYRIAQIVEVVETAKVYQVENTKTNKGLKLRMGTEDRVYRLEYVSNHEFNSTDFQEWLTIMKKYNRPIPTMGEIHKKQKDITSAMNHNYTNDEVDAMIKEKSRFKETPKNFAMTKGELMKKLEYAKQNQEHEEASILQAKIEEVDSKADALDKKRSGDITAIDWINKRNRNMMKEQFLGEKKIEGFMGKEDDPFTRKSGKMRVVSGSAKNLAAMDEDPTSGGISASSSASNLSSTPLSLKSLPTSSKTPDLFSFHSINVGHDELNLNTLRTPVTEDSSRALHSANTSSGGQ